MKRMEKKIFFLIFSLLLGIIYSQFSDKIPSFYPPKSQPTVKGVYSALNQQIATVTRVIDGDTIQIDTGQKIRYIGIDTPELHKPNTPVQCFAKEAAEKNKQLVEGKKIKLVKDVSETDRYGRLLRYVYLEDPTAATNGGTFINEYLVKEGYAHAATFPPDVKYADYFVSLQDQARNLGKGLWSMCY